MAQGITTEGRPVVRSPKQLRLHGALDELGCCCTIEELNHAAQLKDWPELEPIRVTTKGRIFAGFGRWRLATLEGKHEIACLEYPFSDDEALQLILTHHRPKRGWNDFVRIRLALTLQPYFQQKALENMRAGGKYKGSTNLPEAERIDVRQEIAKAAGTGFRNVDKVKAILLHAHPSIIAALQTDRVKIHRAWKWCTLSKSDQITAFAHYEEKRIEQKVLREFPAGDANLLLDPGQVIKTLEVTEAQHPGSIEIRTSRSKRTVVILGQDLLQALEIQREPAPNG
jgi:hypothetical protein